MTGDQHPLDFAFSLVDPVMSYMLMLAASEPAWGSVRANAAVLRPQATCGKYRRFCSAG